MLFVQGMRDALADPALLQPVVTALGHRARLLSVPAADHSFHVPARSGHTDAAVLEVVLDAVAGWVRDRIDRC
jgi:hypothetical protein